MSVRSVVAELDFAEHSRSGAGRVRDAGAPATAPHAADLTSAFLSGLADQPGVGVAICDPDGQITFLNDTLLALLGRPRSAAALAATGLRDFADHLLRLGRDPLSRALAGEASSGEVYTLDAPSPGAGRALKCTAFPLPGPAGVLGAALVTVEVTASVAARRELEELRHELVDTVNHEVRTPLAVIAGHMELLGDEPEPRERNWSLRAIGRATSQLGSVVETISAMADESLRTLPAQR